MRRRPRQRIVIRRTVDGFQQLDDARGEAREPLELLVHHHEIPDAAARALDERVGLAVPRRDLTGGSSAVTGFREKRKREHGPANHGREILHEVLIDDALLELEVEIKLLPRRRRLEFLV